METEDILQVIKEVSATVIEPRWRNLTAAEVFEKHRDDLVTVADREAEQALTDIFHKLVPGCAVVGEEASFVDPDLISVLPDVEVGFVIDPIDGTHNFVDGFTEYAVMVAETHSGVTVRSWIWQPALGKAYVAEQGAGVWCNGQQLPKRVPDTRPAIGFSSNPRWVGKQPQGLGKVVKSPRCYGVSYPKICEGDVDYLINNSKRHWPWDHLPGVLMVRECGGDAQVGDGRRYNSGAIDGTLVVAAWPELITSVAEGIKHLA